MLLAGANLGSLGYTLGSLAGPYTALASAVQQMEGYRPGTIAYRNNNPGNLMYVGQPGATQGEGGFAKFASYQDGFAALERQLGLYAGRGMTISEMTAVYAPAGHGSNDPQAYAQYLANKLGVSPNTPLTDLQAAAAEAAMIDDGTAPEGAVVNLDDPSMLIALGIIGLATFIAVSQ